MAVASNVPRPALLRTRTHGGAAPTVRPLIKTTRNVQIETRPALHVVPVGRRAARWVGLAATVIFVLMIAAAAFQTQLARRQLEIDRLNKAMDSATQTYDNLRRERAELRSPVRLNAEAGKRDMVTTEDSRFVTINPELLAEAETWMGPVSTGAGESTPNRLEQFERVKRVLDGKP